MKATVFPSGSGVTNEQLAAFLIVARQYGLNPFIREVYGFPGKGGGIIPIVSIDGWTSLINRQRYLDGIEFEDHLENGKLAAITCRIFRKDRSKPTEVTEYLAECQRETEPWKKWPARMLRHKALIQCARYAFSLSGISDEDEAERQVEPPPTGKLELETDSVLHEKKLHAPVSAAPLLITVGDKLTIVQGNFRPVEIDLPKLGAKWEREQKAWTMPAGRTHELLALCEQKNLAYQELTQEKPIEAEVF